MNYISLSRNSYLYLVILSDTLAKRHARHVPPHAWNIISVHKRRAAGSLRIPWSNKIDNTRKIRRGNHHPGAQDAAADNNLVVNIS